MNTHAPTEVIKRVRNTRIVDGLGVSDADNDMPILPGKQYVYEWTDFAFEYHVASDQYLRLQVTKNETGRTVAWYNITGGLRFECVKPAALSYYPISMKIDYELELRPFGPRDKPIVFFKMFQKRVTTVHCLQ